MKIQSLVDFLGSFSSNDRPIEEKIDVVIEEMGNREMLDSLMTFYEGIDEHIQGGDDLDEDDFDDDDDWN